MSYPCAHCASDGRDVREQCWACNGWGRTATDTSGMELCEGCNEPFDEKDLDHDCRCEKCAAEYAERQAELQADRDYERMMETHPCDGRPPSHG